MDQALVTAAAIVFPGHGLAVEITCLKQHLGIVAQTNIIITPGRAVVVIINMDPAKAHPGHPLFAKRRVPVVMHRDVELARVLRGIAVAVADEIDEVVAGVPRVSEFTPRHRHPIAGVGNIEATVGTIDKGAMIDPDVGRFLQGQAITVTHAGGVGEVQVPNDDIIFAHGFEITNEAGIGSDAADGFVRPKSYARRSQVNRARNVHDASSVVFYCVGESGCRGHCHSRAARSARGVAIDGGIAVGRHGCKGGDREKRADAESVTPGAKNRAEVIFF